MTGNAAEASQPSPFISGPIFGSLNVVRTVEAQKPGIATYLVQGATGGAVVELIDLIIGLFSESRYYSYLFPRAVPKFLGAGLAIGSCLGLLNWGTCKLTGRRMGLVSRAVFSIVGYVVIMNTVFFLLRDQRVEAKVFDWHLGFYGLFRSLTMGSLVGSGLRPLHQLSRGTTFAKGPGEVIARISGFLLRLAILFLLSESIVIFLFFVRIEAHQPTVVFVLLGLSHFLLAAFLVFAPFKFIWLSLSAFIINAPVISFFFEFQNLNWVSMYLAPSYLVLWGIFLLTRSRLVQAALCIFNEEVRYYLID